MGMDFLSEFKDRLKDSTHEEEQLREFAAKSEKKHRVRIEEKTAKALEQREFSTSSAGYGQMETIIMPAGLDKKQTFADIWKEGEESTEGGWASGKGLKFRKRDTDADEGL